MLTANPNFETFVGFSAFANGNPHQRADALLIDANKWILGQKTVHNIAGQKLTRIVARQPQAGLGQVIGAKREKLSFLGNFVGHEAGPRQLDHRPDEIADFNSVEPHGCLRRLFHDVSLRA